MAWKKRRDPDRELLIDKWIEALEEDREHSIIRGGFQVVRAPDLTALEHVVVPEPAAEQELDFGE